MHGRHLDHQATDETIDCFVDLGWRHWSSAERYLDDGQSWFEVLPATPSQPLHALHIIPDRPRSSARRPPPHLEETGPSNFHIQVSWCPSERTLQVSDPVLDWSDDRVMPPMFPLDDCMALGLPEAAEQVQAEMARRGFAAAGLLDATRIHLRGGGARTAGACPGHECRWRPTQQTPVPAAW
jgi:hypothetical protein